MRPLLLDSHIAIAMISNLPLSIFRGLAKHAFVTPLLLIEKDSDVELWPCRHEYCCFTLIDWQHRAYSWLEAALLDSKLQWTTQVCAGSSPFSADRSKLMRSLLMQQVSMRNYERIMKRESWEGDSRLRLYMLHVDFKVLKSCLFVAQNPTTPLCRRTATFRR